MRSRRMCSREMPRHWCLSRKSAETGSLPSALIRETRTCRLAVFGQVACRYSSQASRALRVSSPRRCRWPARVMRGLGRSMSSRVSSRMAWTGGVHGRQGDGQALGGSHGRLPGSPDLLSGHRQQGAPGAPAAAEVPGRVGERQAVSFREPEQRAQRRDGVVAPVSAQRLQDGVDVTGGDLPQVAACRCPALDERPHDAEVNPHGGRRPWAGAGVTVEQRHQPGTDVTAEPGGQLAGAAVDPGLDRRRGVVVQQLHLSQDLSDPGG